MRHVTWSAAMLGAMITATAQAAQPPTPPAAKTEVDSELLEFLGSLDEEDEGWQEYLETKPVRPEAGKSAGKDAARPPAPDVKQVKGK